MIRNRHRSDRHISTPSSRTIHAELLRLCARIGYSPPASRR
jgi:hypothetical protein